MGTNFYLISKNRELIHEKFVIVKNGCVTENEYELVETPELSYRVHLNKLSCGWRPLFQGHKAFQSFRELEKFYLTNKESLEIYDEYNQKLSWNEYRERVKNHGACESEAFKWVYEVDEIFKDLSPWPTLHITKCLKEEAELFTPFDHCIYWETEKQARKKFHAYDSCYMDVRYWNDPDYPYDWTDMDFS